MGMRVVRNTVGPGSAPKKAAHAVARPRRPEPAARRSLRVPWISLSVTLTRSTLSSREQSREAAHRDLDGLRRDEPALDDGKHHGGDEDVDEGRTASSGGSVVSSSLSSGARARHASGTPGAVKLRPPAGIDGGGGTCLRRKRGRRSRPLASPGVFLEAVTIGWNSVEAVLAIALGMLAGSTALVGFGFDSVIEGDLRAGRALAPPARAARRSRAGGSGARRARALKVVGVCFLALALYVAWESAGKLWRGEGPDPSPLPVWSWHPSRSWSCRSWRGPIAAWRGRSAAARWAPTPVRPRCARIPFVRGRAGPGAECRGSAGGERTRWPRWP